MLKGMGLAHVAYIHKRPPNLAHNYYNPQKHKKGQRANAVPKDV